MGASWQPWLCVSLLGMLIGACVGDDVDPQTPGIAKGPCYANGTCNESLQCVENRCEVAETSSSSSSSSSGSSSSCEQAPPVSAPRRVACGDVTCSPDQQEHCCAGKDPADSLCVALGVSCPAALHDWQCANSENCASGNVCCLTPLDLTSTCPPSAESGGTQCKVSCEGPEVTLCQFDRQCGGGKKCRYLNITGPDRRAVGACL